MTTRTRIAELTAAVVLAICAFPGVSADAQKPGPEGPPIATIYDCNSNSPFACGNFQDGMNELNKHNAATSLEYFNIAIKNDDRFIQALLGRATAYDMLGRYPEALVDFNRVISLNPNIAGYYEVRGTFKQNSLKDYIGAISDFTSALNLDDRLTDSYFARGRAEYILQEYGRAEVDLTKAIDLDPNQVDYHIVRGMMWRDKGNSFMAYADFSEAVKLAPNNQQARQLWDEARIKVEHDAQHLIPATPPQADPPAVPSPRPPSGR